MIALDDYTATNGATVIVPDSHTWDSKRVPSREETIPVIMPSGSIIYFVSTLWHGGGANTSNESRLALTAQYCQPWIRPMENLILAVDWEKLDDIPEKLVGMLGYKVGNPFIGFVNGGSPRAAVQRLLEKWTGKGKVEAKL
jgi:ectoine hydroxylase-related dioxygenase (phytanoyl-CoA dioxygenase family)